MHIYCSVMADNHDSSLALNLGSEHRYDKASNNEALAWGTRVFALCILILEGDRSTAQRLTMEILRSWEVALSSERKRVSKSKNPYSTNPDEILRNRYHLLQTKTFNNLLPAEVESERDLKDITPWVLIFRFVKAVFQVTARVSEDRTLGMLRILRGYKSAEVARTFLELSHIEHDYQYFANRQLEMFGGKRGFYNRFAAFTSKADGASSWYPFELDTGTTLIEWIKQQISTHLLPWGCYCQEGAECAVGQILAAVRGVNQTTGRVIYCAADEFRMLLLSSPELFRELVDQLIVFGGRRFEKGNLPYKEIQVPYMRVGNNNSRTSEAPPDHEPWTANEQVETLAYLRTAADTARYGWRSTDMVVRTSSGKEIADRQLTRTVSIQTTVPVPALVNVYLRSHGSEFLLYQTDLVEGHETIGVEEFRAEGAQEVKVSYEVEGPYAKFTINYSEPWYWHFARLYFTGWGKFLALRPIVTFAAVALILMATGLIYFQFKSIPIPMIEGPTQVENESEAPIPEPFSGDDAPVPLNDKPPRKERRPLKADRGGEIDGRRDFRRHVPRPVRIDGEQSRVAENFVNSDPLTRDPGIELPAYDRSSSRGGKITNTSVIANPNGTNVLASRVVVSWTPNPAATSYQVQFTDSADRLVAWFDVKTTEVKVNGLSPGEIYYLEVYPLGTPQKKVTTARSTFGTLSESAAEDVLESERKFKSDKLLLGIAYLKKGMLDEALMALSEYKALHPNSRLARRLVKRIHALRPNE